MTECCDAKSLKSLRLASRGCAAKLHRVYVRFFFTNIGVLLCREHSISAAVNVIHHPVFGPSVQTISFYVDPIPLPKWPPMSTFSLEHRVATGKFRNEYDNMRHQSTDVRLLRELFSELKKQSRILPLKIDGDADLSSHPPIGLGAMMNNHGTLYLDTYDIGPVSILVTAIEKSKYQPASLSISSTASIPVHRADIDNHRSSRASPTPLQTVVQGLKHLDIAIWCDYRSQMNAIEFGAVLASAPILETLTLRIKSDNPEETHQRPEDSRQIRRAFLDVAGVVEIILKRTMPTLTKLAIHGPAAAFGDLVSFVRRHDRLQEVELKGAKIWCGTDDERCHNITTSTETVSQALIRLTKLSVVDVDKEADQWWEDRDTWLI
ncbi:hypothetical protein CLAFUW4_14304 [Fulvia fulva]|uniref:Uncharacterized protein n=1 Tax=Passalora fulva TaxID=5499 RepID=A0A9Q8PLW6_PASFU|nr:uncharacterized protein CLAFUR5_14137 [Fulvia fulva]KAK4609356.1 hypothetical protein CLAFUR4_14304 [Fulvia fulva]KAK4609680.1 hypothetical protein CLAFUR0_14308 [Fulvia fulva]UJO24873.1 hypothetical protein CLAFUR5_14137 [Fulvia fulva]WPV22819.1 hypothetical protein CLAFUW4_14304 [Fulvia fulva]WPV37521.1 hypothetical protein CLAFUW7_14312 [Fulvia fulva]